MTKTSEKKAENRRNRFITGAIAIPIVAVLLYFRSWYMGVVIVTAVLITIFEEFLALKVGGYRPVTIPTWIICVAYLPLQLIFPTKNTLFPLLCAMFFLQAILLLSRKKPHLPDLLVSNMPLFTLAVPGMCYISFLNVQPVSLQILFLVGSTVTSVICDILAYEVGSRIGKHPFFHNVSPNKTLEGALGGALGGILSMVIVGVLVNLSFGVQHSTLLGYALIGLGCAVAAEVGDLFASLVKRHCGIKDFGTLFPGHGGMLDRMDSVLFTATYMYCIKLLFF